MEIVSKHWRDTPSRIQHILSKHIGHDAMKRLAVECMVQ